MPVVEMCVHYSSACSATRWPVLQLHQRLPGLGCRRTASCERHVLSPSSSCPHNSCWTGVQCNTDQAISPEFGPSGEVNRRNLLADRGRAFTPRSAQTKPGDHVHATSRFQLLWRFPSHGSRPISKHAVIRVVFPGCWRRFEQKDACWLSITLVGNQIK